MKTTNNKPVPRSISDYADIINLQRPISKTRSHLSRSARAAQFAPYAALVGHRDLIKDEETIAADKIDLDHEITIEPLDN